MTDRIERKPVPRSAPFWFAAGPQLALAGAAWLGAWSREAILLTLVVAGSTAMLVALWTWFREDRSRRLPGGA